MVDPDIKKIRIKSEELPFIQFNLTKVAAIISNVSANGTTITYTTASNHDLLPGQRVRIFGISPSSYNLDGLQIATVPSATTFTITDGGTGTYVSGGIVEFYSTYDAGNSLYIKQDYINNLYYDFRYRVASEDKNRYSHWSQIETIIMPDVTTPFPYASDARISISKGGNPEVITTVWTRPSVAENPSNYEKIFNKINIFDIWIRWNETNGATDTTTGWTNWEFVATVSANTFSVVKSVGTYKTIDVAVQIPTNIKVKDYHHNKLTLYRKKASV